MNKYEKIKIFSDICDWLKCHAYEYTELEFLPDKDDPQSYINYVINYSASINVKFNF